MDLGSLLIMVGLLAVVIVFLARPLVERNQAAPADGGSRLSVLLAERDQILAMIREVEMDHAMGKVAAEDFQAQRAALVTRGAAVLREIDTLGGTAATRGGATDDLEAAIEARVASRRAGRAGEAGFCTRCGQGLQSGDRFCVRCGTPAPQEKEA
jgi:zinc-ribbon domain